jgi:DnaJ-class molecular chaperone
MATADELRDLLSKMPKLSYFEILGLPHKWAKPGEVKAAFHAFAQLYHPDQHGGEDDATKELSKEVFKRAVEAYEVLRDADLQKRYVEKYLKKGRRRLPPNAFGKEEPMEAPKPPPPPKTWVEEMTTDDGREVARRIERMIEGNRLQAAFQQFGILEEVERGNEAVARKLRELKRKMGVK